MRRAGARTCPDPVHAAQADSSRRPCLRPPAPAPFAEKSRGSSATLSALGETRVSPPQSRLQATARTMYPWAPLSVPLNFPHLLGGAPGPLSATPLSVSSPAAMFFAAKSGPLAHSSSALGGGGGQGFCCPEPWTSQPGNGGHQVPCLEPLLPHTVFPGGRVSAHHGQTAAVRADPGGPIPCPVFFGTSWGQGRRERGRGLSRAESCFLSPITHTLPCLPSPPSALDAGTGRTPVVPYKYVYVYIDF